MKGKKHRAVANPWPLLSTAPVHDSSTAVGAVTGRSGVLGTLLGHYQAPPYDPATASVKELDQVSKIPEQVLHALLASALIHCFN